MSLLEGELANIIGDALVGADIPYDLTVIRMELGQGNPDRPWEPGQPVAVSYPCKGFTDTYNVHEQSASVIQSGDIKIVIVANTLSITPEPNMSVQARGVTYRVIDVSPDPALATYQVQARR